MNPIPPEIDNLLEQCQIKDRYWAEQKLHSIRQRQRRKQPVDKMLTQLRERLDSSVEQVKKRVEGQAEIHYPDLPVSQRREELLELVKHNQIVVVAGETGSGKTTQLPKICLELGYGVKGLIGHTQPRRLAARTVAARIAEELNTPLGNRVGYQVRFTDQITDQTQVKLMTDGILLASIQHDPKLLQYEVLIIDEAHERSLNIDFLLGYLKRLLPQRPDLKVIITSATIDVQRFSKHFADAPVIEVSGRTYPVEVLYRPPLEAESSNQLPQSVADAVEELEQLERSGNKSQGDVLVFLSGEREIRETAQYLRKAQSNTRSLRHCEILPLYARLSIAEQNRVFHLDTRKGRRIVLATNVAETSLTVPGIKYVIDTGTARISRYSYRSKVQRLPVEAISQASANQRAGRCGRVSAGICIRLYSEEDFTSRPEFTDAEIQRTNLAAVILQMLSLKLGDISEFPFVDPPDNRYINDGFKLLQELGAVDQKRHITKIGWQLSRLPIDPRLGRMVIEAAKTGAVREVMIIVSALSVQDPRERPQEKQQASDEKHRVYAHEESDFLTWVNLWDLYEEQRQELSQNQLRKFCAKHFLSFMRMREWRDTHRQLHLICKELQQKDSRFVEKEQAASYEAVHKALLAGLLSHLGIKQENKEYLGARNRRFFLFPGSVVYKKAPKWVMAAEMVETSKLFARCIARIDPTWAEPLAGKLLKHNYSEPHWEKKRAEVVAIEQVLLYGLIIVPKRRVSYGRIDPQVAHELFIRQGLVEGLINCKADFIQKNRVLLQDVEAMEAKSRRKDLLVDEEQLYEFYRLRLKNLGGEQIVNGQGFHKWLKELEPDQSDRLLMQEEDILQRSADHVSAAAYPDTLQSEKLRLNLKYHFAPGEPDDGVTIEVPLPLLTSLEEKRLAWLVPGMLHEKCTALLKGLPKQQRKHYVPVPNYVEAFVNVAQFAAGDLYESFAHQLLRMTGVRLEPELLNASELPDHLKMNIRLLDEKGRTITQSRSLAELTNRYASEVSSALQKEPDTQWGREGITQWDFEELPESVMVTQFGNVEVEAYPALEAAEDAVTLCLKTTLSEAEQVTRAGLIRLALLDLKETSRYLRKKLKNPDYTRMLLMSGGLLHKDKLLDDIIWQACGSILLPENGVLRSAEAFRAASAECKEELVPRAEQIMQVLFACMELYQQIQKALKGKVRLDEVSVLNDIKAQLDALFPSAFLRQNSWDQLQQYPRYLKAIVIRLEKFRRNLRQETLLSNQLVEFMHLYQTRLEKHQKEYVYDPELSQFRWLVEEYRVSLFAQQLGTRVPISEKRLKQQWLKVRS